MRSALALGFGGVAFPVCGPRLPCGRDDPEYEGDHDHRGRGDTETMPFNEPRGAITRGVVTRDHRQIAEVAVDIRGELFDRAVPPFRLLSQGVKNDILDIAG